MIPDLTMYQWLLLAIGAYLDEESSSRTSLAEVSNALLVRLQRALHTLELQVDHFKRETLLEQLEAVRGSHRAARQTCQRFRSSFPNAHQDFFRVLSC